MLLCFIISLKVFQRFSQHMSWERYFFFPMRLNSTLLLLYMAHKYNDSLGMVRYHNHSTTSIQLFQISTSIPSINIRIMDDVITFNICVQFIQNAINQMEIYLTYCSDIFFIAVAVIIGFMAYFKWILLSSGLISKPSLNTFIALLWNLLRESIECLWVTYDIVVVIRT